jgi:phosphatidylglycerophosphate synthase
LDACHPGAWKKVGGIPLVARFLFHLNTMGLKRLLLLWDSEHPPENLERWRGAIHVEPVQVRNGLSPVLSLASTLSDCFIYIDAGHLIDPRLLRTLMTTRAATLCHMDSESRERKIIRAGLLNKEDLSFWSQQGSTALIDRAAELFPGDVQTFRSEIRGPSIPYFLEVRSDSDAQRATRLLIRSQQKQVMDLPARYLHPPFENALTSLLLSTSISPNGVTLIVALLAFLVTWLFWHGYFVSGALLTFAVDVLDGVDGKLARTKLQFSWLGTQEHLIDYFYENSWYVALGVGLNAATGTSLPLFCAAAMVLSDTADNIFYTLAGRWHGKSIDLFSRFDRNFRLIAGRRNVYGCFFIVGFSMGYVLQTFVMATLWAMTTAAIHGIRLHRYRETHKKHHSEGREPS